MNGIDYITDTNCFIYFLIQHPIMSSFISENWAYSYITEIKLLSKKNLTQVQELIIKSLLNDCVKINHNQEISDLSMQPRKSYNLKLADAIIAATSNWFGIPLLTADKGFAKITNLDCLILDI